LRYLKDHHETCDAGHGGETACELGALGGAGEGCGAGGAGCSGSNACWCLRSKEGVSDFGESYGDLSTHCPSEI
jgi:hypothetical protein